MNHYHCKLLLFFSIIINIIVVIIITIIIVIITSYSSNCHCVTTFPVAIVRTLLSVSFLAKALSVATVVTAQ